jgi:hypothetical protein
LNRALGKSKNKPIVLVKHPRVKIKAKLDEYVLVLNQAGQLQANYPIMEFEVTNGTPNYLVDVQVARRYADLLMGGPGLANAWDKTAAVKQRIDQRPFSSWSNGEKALKLDATGKATYKIPLEWWCDQARIAKKLFDEVTYFYRVLIFEKANSETIYLSTDDRDYRASPKVKVKNNLTDFKVYNLRYHKDDTTDGMWLRYARIEFKVREADTAKMYNMVQWKKGGRINEDGSDVWGVTDYGVEHTCKYSNWQIDRVATNPRYWDGDPVIEADKKTAYYEDDVSCGPPDPGHTAVTLNIDFISKMHLNCDIPAAVTIKTESSYPDGRKNIYQGVIDENVTLILAEASWSAKMKVSEQPAGGYGYEEL